MVTVRWWICERKSSSIVLLRAGGHGARTLLYDDLLTDSVRFVGVGSGYAASINCLTNCSISPMFVLVTRLVFRSKFNSVAIFLRFMYNTLIGIGTNSPFPESRSHFACISEISAVYVYARISSFERAIKVGSIPVIYRSMALALSLVTGRDEIFNIVVPYKAFTASHVTGE